MTIGLSPVLRMVDGKPGHLLHRCAACSANHFIDVHALNRDGRVIGWDGTFERPTFGQPIRHDKDGAVCEYILQAGVQYFLESCSHNLRGQSRHLEAL